MKNLNKTGWSNDNSSFNNTSAKNTNINVIYIKWMNKASDLDVLSSTMKLAKASSLSDSS